MNDLTEFRKAAKTAREWIIGTSSLDHLRENLTASRLVLPEEAITRLDTIG